MISGISDPQVLTISPDAIHSQRKAAELLVATKAGHYIFGVKKNQPTLWNAGIDAIGRIDIDSPEYWTHSFTFGRPTGGPAAYWRAAAARGEDPMGFLQGILKQRPGRASNEDSSGRAVVSYTWPSVFVTQRCEIGRPGYYLGARTRISK